MAQNETINVALTRDEWIAVMRTIDWRQRDCRKVTPEFKEHKTFQSLDVEYEKVKMKISEQLPSLS